MIRRSVLLFVVLLCGAATAGADERVPEISDVELPVAGTCAPIQAGNVTYIRLGPPGDLKWFAVNGLRSPIDYPQLVQLLRQRAGTRQPSPHGVWITVSRRHSWLHVLAVIKAVYEAHAGLYRVGLRVRSEATGQVMGFPLFIPPDPSGRAGPKAGVLNVRVDAKHPREVNAPSDVGHVYAAARGAVKRMHEFGVERVIAKLWISPNAPIGLAVHAMDLLYRGGCAGVRLQLSLRASWRGLRDVVPLIEIQGVKASTTPQKLKPPPVAPHATPWPLDGANEAGWVDFQVKELPSLDAPAGAGPAGASKPRPNYAAAPGGVPPKVMLSVDYEVRTWAYRLGQDLAKMLRESGPPTKEDARHFAAAARREEILPGLLTAARRAFPGVTHVVPYAMQFSAFLFDRGALRGRADLTLLTAGDRERLRLLFASWRPLDPTTQLTLVPFEVDPFAGGENAAFRIWTEGLLHQVKARGVAGLPLAEAAHVLPELPAVAYDATTKALAARGAQLSSFAGGLSRTPYDRVVLVPLRTTASVLEHRKVVGVLDLRLTAEEGELRIADLVARPAR